MVEQYIFEYYKNVLLKLQKIEPAWMNRFCTGFVKTGVDNL